jgi:hypothetical protein
MGLKVSLPRRVSGVAAEGVKNGFSLTWQAGLNCNGSAVSGYNLYRATSAGGPLREGEERLHHRPCLRGHGARGRRDLLLRGDSGGCDCLEGARSAAVGETAGSDTIHVGSSGGGGGGGCFVATAKDRLIDGKRAARLAAVTRAASLLVLLAPFSLRRGRARRPGDRSPLPEDRPGTEGR